MSRITYTNKMHDTCNPSGRVITEEFNIKESRDMKFYNLEFTIRGSEHSRFFKTHEYTFVVGNTDSLLESTNVIVHHRELREWILNEPGDIFIRSQGFGWRKDMQDREFRIMFFTTSNETSMRFQEEWLSSYR